MSSVEKVDELIYRRKVSIHDINPGEKVFVFIHQTHAGKPHMNTFSVSVYPYPVDAETRNLLMEKLFKSKQNLHGYSRILVADLID